MVKIEFVKYEDIEAPPVLYKYRHWDNEFHRKTITVPSVYLSSPSGFEDPLDCKIPIRYDLLRHAEFFDKLVTESKRVNKHFLSFQDHFNWAGNRYLESALHDPKRLRELEDRISKDYDAKIGILSLTAYPLNLTMWNNYSNRNKGFCVGYDSKLLFRFLGGGREVEYPDELPIIMPFIEPHMMHYLRVYHKEKKWEFEREYRTLKFWEDGGSINQRNIRIAKECILEVLLGPKIEIQHKTEIEKIISEKLPHVIIKETKIENGVVVYK
jgi:hypothetical protein